MSTDLKEMLQSVLQESLKPIRTRLDSIETEVRLLRSDVADVKQSVHRIEANQPADIGSAKKEYLN